jgi:hypothetical protein
MEKKCFVAMPFDESFKDIYEYSIKEAIEEAGYVCIRGDELPCGGSILKNIVQNINRSHLIIVDMTTKNPNVMYELGLAHGLIKNVILIVRDMSDVPFDLSSYHIITYQKQDDLKCGKILKKSILKAIESFENKKTILGNPVQDYLDKDEQPVAPEIFKQTESELDKKNQEVKELSIRLDTLESYTQKSMQKSDVIKKDPPIEHVYQEKQTSKKKLDFKFIGQRK